MKGLAAPEPTFQIGSPLFDRVTICLPQNIRKGEFIIETENNPQQNIYVQEAYLNGNLDKSLRLPYSELVKGGSLKLIMKKNRQTTKTYL
ncbi:glycoside hydrolase domain-containing protein [uncultured Proteiniphilum sp.]|uniref:glycoside hydrolase domain-containing protein n=1 Tax=uncultured Proteiniphilum sp. TaxID=497637 RepID=UPI00344BD861